MYNRNIQEGEKGNPDKLGIYNPYHTDFTNKTDICWGPVLNLDCFKAGLHIARETEYCMPCTVRANDSTLT